MWAPNVLIGVIGILGLRAASRSAGTNRGGDLADLRDVLFGWLAPPGAPEMRILDRYLLRATGSGSSS